eukprot:CAMPEP_0172534150 /NCGR_PEP_ID=MMETSP1067-20121228/6614_1 /TAXON_ID=265564 ORGANISM="Thalassiosira punctigera, Strain Tpunct2005C2" /NCGR_SAMPLE_ID=MMETSP1067 /ASSEMBLY_ACC=CAM_ASM_000444 /LENGTH=913 /DNA_ID=CAMNT_0013318901 /DNA_START=128 /DNA_END=2869 /DNA_ORIENTATION=+
MPAATNTWLNKIAKEKTKLLQEMFAMEPIHVEVKDPRTKKLRPHQQGEDIVYLWDKIYAADEMMQGIVVDTVVGPSTPGRDYVDDTHANPAMPYQQLRALVGDGGKWKWPEIWKNLDLLPRRGPAWRHIDDPSNLGKIENPNPHVVPLNCLVVGGGPVGLRLAIELILGGHRVTLFEKRREAVDKESGLFEKLGFTNRVNRPHINNFCRNDLESLNGRNFMTPKMCYPVFTNTHTSSIGIDESQMLLLKTALLLGVRFELGVGYADAEVDIENEKNQRPTWLVQYTADPIAQERYGKSETGEQRFDCLFGCDGGASRVRSSQVEWLGEPKTRLYKKMFGIVSNLRKVGRSKLKELGHETGLEPEDRAGGTTGVFFYKASYHNYFIVHPPADEMEANGIPWKGIYSFNHAQKGVNEEKEDTKRKLRTFMTKKAKELGIPIDENLPNGGFVEEPNDVMGFDFSEFYNCEKSAACMVPPLDWNADEDGEWEIHCPLVALCGDAVADPNWLLGVGLQRGWNSAMDACFYADNVYNNKTFNGEPPSKDEPIEGPIEWLEHMDNMMNLMQKLGNASRDSKLSDEMDTGMLDEKGPIVIQMRRALASRKVEAPVPAYLPLVAPWGRYKQFTLAVKNNYKGKDLLKNIHPLATRELTIFEHNAAVVSKGAVVKMKVTRPSAALITWPKRFECSVFWGMMKLLEIDGRAAPGEKPLDKPEKSKQPPPEDVKPVKHNVEEVKNIAKKKSIRLRESIVMQAMNPSPAGVGRKDRGGLDSLISQAASRGKAMQTARGEENFSPSPVNTPPPSQRKGSVQRRESALSPGDMSAITNLASQLSKATTPVAAFSGPSDPMHDVRLETVRYEKATIASKLDVAEKTAALAQAERDAADAKMAAARTEVAMLENLLAAYERAESKMKDMA